MTAKRNTWQREAVRAALAEAGGFVSAQALHQRLSTTGRAMGLATVYRALTDLADAHEADSLHSPGGEVLYRACTAQHHHHLICRHCGRTEEVSAEPVERWAHAVAAEHGFDQAANVVDVFGRCADCAAKAVSATDSLKP